MSLYNTLQPLAVVCILYLSLRYWYGQAEDTIAIWPFLHNVNLHDPSLLWFFIVSV